MVLLLLTIWKLQEIGQFVDVDVAKCIEKPIMVLNCHRNLFLVIDKQTLARTGCRDADWGWYPEADPKWLSIILLCYRVMAVTE